MLRSDRGLTERLFSDGLLKVELIHFWLKSSILDYRLIKWLFVLGSCLYSHFSMGCKSACSYCCYKGKSAIQIMILYCFWFLTNWCLCAGFYISAWYSGALSFWSFQLLFSNIVYILSMKVQVLEPFIVHFLFGCSSTRTLLAVLYGFFWLYFIILNESVFL